MHAATFLTKELQRDRLRQAASDDLAITFATSWTELDRLIRRSTVEVAVVDPCGPERIDVARVEQLRSRYPLLPLLLYMPFTPEVADALLRLGDLGVRNAVFLDQGDEPSELGRAVEARFQRALSEQILRHVLEGLDVDSREIETAFRAALRHAGAIRSAQDWSHAVRTSHRTFYRLFRTYGLPTPKRSLLWLRLMYAARLLENPGFSLYDVVGRLGYSAPSNFWHHTRDMLGLRASEFRYAVDFEILLDRFLQETR